MFLDDERAATEKPYVSSEGSPVSGQGIAALVLGAFAVAVSFLPVLGLPALVLGPLAIILAVIARNRQPRDTVTATAGLAGRQLFCPTSFPAWTVPCWILSWQPWPTPPAHTRTRWRWGSPGTMSWLSGTPSLFTRGQPPRRRSTSSMAARTDGTGSITPCLKHGRNAPGSR